MHKLYLRIIGNLCYIIGAYNLKVRDNSTNYCYCYMERKVILNRKLYNKLLDWKKETNGKKALLIEGARRIGKSTLCEQFAKNEYESYLIIDFAIQDPRVESIFRENLGDLDTFFMLLEAHYGVSLRPRKSVIIFDEVQMFPYARTAIKYLVADGRYDYIETGSLISIKDNVKNILIPSEERSITMYPLDLEEFASALGKTQLLEYARICFEKKTPLERSMHNEAMLLFQEYMLVGGMPRPVVTYMESRKDFTAVDKEKRDILKLYKQDIMKIDAQYRSKVLSIFEQIPGFLSGHERRVVFNKIKPGTHAEQYGDTFFWLADSMICNECFLCNDPNVGLSLNENRGYIKCYMGDTGLLVSHAFDENELLENEVYKQILAGKLQFNKGMIYENAIAQMLVANGHKLFFYTHYNDIKHRNDIEIDFLTSNNSKLKYKIFPIEVKSSKHYKATSLIRFNEKFKTRIGESYIIHPRNLTVKDNIISIPPYMTTYL